MLPTWRQKKDQVFDKPTHEVVVVLKSICCKMMEREEDPTMLVRVEKKPPWFSSSLSLYCLRRPSHDGQTAGSNERGKNDTLRDRTGHTAADTHFHSKPTHTCPTSHSARCCLLSEGLSVYTQTQNSMWNSHPSL